MESSVANTMPKSLDKSADRSEEVCGLCDRSLRDRDKALKSINCKKCKKSYHVQCSGLPLAKVTEITSKNISWFCGTCKRQTLNERQSLTRNKSVSDEQIRGTPSSYKPNEDEILQGLNEMSGKLQEYKAAAKNKEPSVGEATHDKDGYEKWRTISERIDILLEEIDDVKSILREQDDRIVELENTIAQQCSENEKVKVELESVRTTLEMNKQITRLGDFIICGLPIQATIDPEKAFGNMCKKIKVDLSAYPDRKLDWRVMKVENKAVGEQRLEVKNCGVTLMNTIMKKYKEARISKKALVSKDLVDEGDSKPIYLNESLTSYFQFLFKMARDMRRKGLLKYVWVKDGQLCVRKEERSKIFKIKHKNDFEKFK